MGDHIMGRSPKAEGRRPPRRANSDAEMPGGRGAEAPRSCGAGTRGCGDAGTRKCGVSSLRPHAARRATRIRSLTVAVLKRTPHSAFRIWAAPAFTLVEMMVVVGIIAILLAIAIPVSTALINNQRGKATLSTMQTVETAMASYVSERPLGSESTRFVTNDPNTRYDRLFGPFPPSPTSSFTVEADKAVPSSPDPARVPPGYEDYDPTTLKKFSALVWIALEKPVGIPAINAISLTKAQVGDFTDIECCVLFLQTFSPAAKGILSGLSPKLFANQDKDGIEVKPPAATGLPTQLYDFPEIRDAWDRPLRYSVQVPLKDDTTGQSIPRRWELRSAGADGVFAPTFDATDPNLRASFTSDDPRSDDVILRGP